MFVLRAVSLKAICTLLIILDSFMITDEIRLFLTKFIPPCNANSLNFGCIIADLKLVYCAFYKLANIQLNYIIVTLLPQKLVFLFHPQNEAKVIIFELIEV